MMTEKQDACYHKVKSRYKVWPSAYASGALVQCRKKGASNWGNSSKKSESSIMKGMVDEAGSPAQQAAIAIAMKTAGKKPKNEATYTSPGDTNLPMDEAYRKARQITKQIKYDQTVSEILVSIQMLAEKAGIPENELQGAEDEVYEASRALESAIYGLDEVFKEALERQRYDDEELEEDSDMRYAAEKTPAINPYGGLKDRQFRGSISEISDTKTSTNQTGGFITPEYDDAYQRLRVVAPRLFQYIRNDAPVPLDPILTLKFLSQMRGNEEAVIQRIKQELSKDTKAMYGADHPNVLAERVNRFWKKVINETPTDNPTGASGEGGWRKYKPKPSGEIEEDTAYAGGMGQGGNAGQSYRKFKPKPSGVIKKESSIMKGLRNEGR
jgi:hypothetical protein